MWRVLVLQFQFLAAQLAEHDRHVHPLSHRRHSQFIWAFLGEADLPSLLHSPHAILELLVAFDTHQTFNFDALVVVAAAGVEVVAPAPPHAAQLAPPSRS